VGTWGGAICSVEAFVPFEARGVKGRGGRGTAGGGSIFAFLFKAPGSALLLSLKFITVKKSLGTKITQKSKVYAARQLSIGLTFCAYSLSDGWLRRLNHDASLQWK
jgi:hypothetical protein